MESLGLTSRVVVEDVSPLLEQFVDPAIARHGMPNLSHINLADAIPIDGLVSANPESEEWHDDQKGPLVVTDSTGKTYVIAGWGDFVAAKLSDNKTVLAHHFHLNGQWELPSGDLVLTDRNGASIVIRAQEPTGRDFYPYAQEVLTNALQGIDPRIDLNHLPESARRELIDLVRRLFEAVPTEVVAQARSTIRNNSWQQSLDIPDHLEAFAQQAITALAFDGTLFGERSGAGEELLLSRIFDGTPRSTWRPDSVSGDGSFSGFAEQLRTSKDPVVAQIRRAIVSCLMDFYRVRTADEVTQQGNRLEALLGQSGTSTGNHWGDLPELIDSSLFDLPSMPSGELMEAELKLIIDNFLDHRERRKNAGIPAPE